MRRRSMRRRGRAGRRGRSSFKVKRGRARLRKRIGIRF